MLRRLLFLSLITCLFIKCSQKHPSLSIDELRQEIKEHRAEYLADFVSNPRSPIDSSDFKNVHFYEADISYHCYCDFNKLKKPEAFKMATYAGTQQDYIIFAKVKCEVDNNKFELEIYRNIRYISMPQYKNLGFLPFRDHSNGEESYGGGRYIDVKLDSIDSGKLLVDFNKAYNPYCAYSDGYACPIPPIANHLNFAINAGEKAFTGDKKQRTKD